jgi:hypothetical protein
MIQKTNPSPPGPRDPAGVWFLALGPNTPTGVTHQPSRSKMQAVLPHLKISGSLITPP